MKSLKKTLVLLAVLSLVLTSISPVLAFNDEVGEEYVEPAEMLNALSIFEGDENGNFNAESGITRAEMAVLICKMRGITEAVADASKANASKFTDVPAGEWYTGWVNLAVDSGVIAGFPDNTFRPNDQLTINQAITLVVKVLGKGDYVDKMGTWPGNYIQEAAKLGITDDMVASPDGLASRGNLAILAWAALRTGTWDVISTTLEGEVTLSESDSLLIKYIKDFVAGNGKAANPYRAKLVEKAKVTSTGIKNASLGANQVIIEATDDTEYEDEYAGNPYDLADYVEAQKKPTKGFEEASYIAEDDLSVVAYIPAEVANIADLDGKEVTVLFGKDNIVALIIVTEDSVTESLVTAWDKDDAKLTIDDTTYRVLSDAIVKYFGETIVDETDNDAITAIDELVTALGVDKPDRDFTKALKANVKLNSSNKIEEVDFTFSVTADFTTKGAGATDNLEIEEGTVKSISSSGVVRRLEGGSFFGNIEIEDLEDEEETRVIKDGAVAKLADIAEGDVLTTVTVDGTCELVYVSSKIAEGELKVKDDIATIGSDEYYMALAPMMNEDDDLNDATGSTRDDIEDKLYGETVKAYTNFLGEAVVFLCTSDATTGKVLGVIINDLAEEDFDDEDVEFLKVKILSEKGNKTQYKIYNKKSGKDISEVTGYDISAYQAPGQLVVFEANDEKVIKSDDIEFVEEYDDSDPNNIKGEYDFAKESDVRAYYIGDVKQDGDAGTAGDQPVGLTGDEARGKLTTVAPVAPVATYNFDEDNTVALNSNDNNSGNNETLEVVKWNSLIDENDEIADMTEAWLFVKDREIVYFAADILDYQSSTEQYAVYMDRDVKDDDHFVELVTSESEVDSEGNILTKEYEVSDKPVQDYYDVVLYKLSSDDIETINTAIKSYEFSEAKDEEKLDTNILPILNNILGDVDNDTLKGQTRVESVSDKKIVFTDEAVDNAGVTVGALDDVFFDDTYVIYFVDVGNGKVTKETSYSAISADDYVLAFNSDGDVDESADVLVVINN